MIFDSHAHYDDEVFDHDRHELLSGLLGRGVGRVLNCSADMEGSHKTAALCREYDFIYGAVGIHPHSAKEYTSADLEILKTLTEQEKIQAIGEIGLDYHYDFSPRDVQKHCFEAQLSLAMELSLPVIIHNREAHADTLEMLQKYRPKGVMHSFTGSVEMAKVLVNMGFYIGLGGMVTFKNARKPVEVAAWVPLDHLLLETDCPYLTPVPHRGQRNDSGYLSFVAAKIAELRGITEEEVITVTAQNANRLFNIQKGM